MNHYRVNNLNPSFFCARYFSFSSFCFDYNAKCTSALAHRRWSIAKSRWFIFTLARGVCMILSKIQPRFVRMANEWMIGCPKCQWKERRWDGELLGFDFCSSPSTNTVKQSLSHRAQIDWQNHLHSVMDHLPCWNGEKTEFSNQRRGQIDSPSITLTTDW